MRRARSNGAAFVLGCDSVLEFDGAALGKPGIADAAVAALAGDARTIGILHTGHALRGADRDGRRAPSSTTVHFADVTDAEIERYVATGEPPTVAGAFTIDGLGGWFVERIDGDHHNVVGVSLPTLRAMVRAQGTN